MAARPTWKGYLKISLVNIPVRVFPATDTASTISFNQLHGECQSRIQQRRWCPRCEREVPNTEIVKGYEFEKGRYVVVGEDDLAKVRPASTRVIDLVQFASAGELDPIYFERPYYLAPDGDVAGSAFAVMRDGMTGKVGIGKLALYGREYCVAVQPKDRGFVMYTLRQASEIRAMSEIGELDRVPEAIKPQEAQLARQVIDTFESPLDLKVYKDEYQTELRRIIDAKIAGQEVTLPAEEAPARVVDLMEALRRSLDAVSAGKKTQARATLPKEKAPARAKASEADTGAAAEAVAAAKPASRKRKAS
jgi:DNA end-binding protein Ku